MKFIQFFQTRRKPIAAAKKGKDMPAKVKLIRISLNCPLNQITSITLTRIMLSQEK